MTIKEAAYLLRKSEAAIRWWLRTGRLKGWQPGGPRCAVLVSVKSAREALLCVPRQFGHCEDGLLRVVQHGGDPAPNRK